MVDNNFRNRAIEWLNSRTQDFFAGLAILQQAGFKPGVLRVLAKHGPNGPEAAARLKFQMISYANMTKEEVADEDAELNVFGGKESGTVNDGKSILRAAKLMEEGKKEYSGNVSKMLQKYSQLYKARSKAELDLTKLAQDNDAIVVAERQRLAGIIEKTTNEMERLYPYWQQYSTDGTEPTEEEIEEEMPECEGCSSDDEEQPGNDTDKYSQLSLEELRKVRKSIATKISRAQNLLVYGQEAKGEVPDPILDPLKITKYKAKIERLSAELEQVKQAIAKLG